MEGYIGCCFSLCGYRYFDVSGTDRREILHDGTYRSRPLLGAVPTGIPKSEILGLKFGLFDREYLENALHVN